MTSIDPGIIAGAVAGSMAPYKVIIKYPYYRSFKSNLRKAFWGFFLIFFGLIFVLPDIFVVVLAIHIFVFLFIRLFTSAFRLFYGKDKFEKMLKDNENRNKKTKNSKNTKPDYIIHIKIKG